MKDSYCSYCGAVYSESTLYPRNCLNAECNKQVWSNPTPVAVVLVPVIDNGRNGLVCVKRGIEPEYGKIALPGGYIVSGEDWKEGGAREVFEETGVVIDTNKIELFNYGGFEPVVSSPMGGLLLFMISETIILPYHFTTDEETLSVELLYEPEELAFSSHTKAMETFFRI